MGFFINGEVGREQLEALERELAPMMDIPDDKELERQEMEVIGLQPEGFGPAKGAQGDDLAAQLKNLFNSNFNNWKGRLWLVRFCRLSLRSR